MTEEQHNHVETQDDNPFCHAGMTCHEGCGCAGEDGICHCEMISDRKCTCNGLCGMKK